MAIYHVSGQVIGRSGGRSAVAAASYRSGEKLYDERLGVFHDYSNKEGDVLYKEILQPANAPAWVMDREKLWNEIEKIEKRKDGQLAREFVISLPKELSLEQNIELAREFVNKEFVQRGMVADMCLHDGRMQGGESQPHMHVMLSLREVSVEGFGKKVREWNDKGLLLHWREAWANITNEHLARAGIDMRIDHRRLEVQGIDLVPQNKIGPKSARERYNENVQEHQEIARSNGEKLYDNPEIALKALSQQYSTFTHHDIARVVNRYTFDEEQFNRVYTRVKACPELVSLGIDENEQERYTTKEMLKIEYELSIMAKQHADEKLHYVNENKSKKNEEVVKGYNLSSEQQEAFKHVTDGRGLACVIGFAGAGKSYMLKAAREVWEKQGYNVVGMTLSGIAAENLEEGSGIKSFTVASRLLSWGNNSNRLSAKDVVVIDEAGMLGSRDVFDIMKEATAAKAKVVLVGDPEQLQAIQAGGAFRMIAELCGYVELNEIRRQEVGWQREATFCLATGQTLRALEMYEKHNDVRVFDTREKAIIAMIDNWKQEIIWNKNKSQIMMAYTRHDVERLNLEARKIMEGHNVLGISHEIQTERGKRSFAENERIYFLRNNKELGVKNGTLGTIREIKDNKLTVELEKGKITFNILDYNYLEYGYATTVYKAQGITIDKAHVLASPNYNRHAVYVAMSRHREEVKLYWAKEDFNSFNSLKKRLGRAQHKDVSLDYIDIARSFAANRNIEINFSGVARSFNGNVIKPAESSKDIENRLEARYNEWMVSQDISNLKEKLGKRVSFELENGDIGKYLGITRVGNEKYGVIEQRNVVKLVSAKFCKDLERNTQVRIATTENQNKTMKIKAISQSKKLTMEM